MPALVMRLRLLHVHGLRLASCALVVALVVGLGLTSADPVSARDWSPYIASLRGSQLAYESAMRSADIQLRSIQHSLRRARRSVAKAERAVARTKDRHEQKKERLQAVRLRWMLSRARLEAASVAPPALLDLSAALRSATLPPLAQAAAPEAADDLSLVLPATSAVELANEARGFLTSVLAARADLATEGRELRRLEKSVARSRQRVARAGRNERLRTRHVAALRRARGAATARREGAEGGLSYAILGMSSYAQRRIAKKTAVRPGITSSFIWPTRGRLSQGYGRGHDGIDIAGYRGTPIRAAAVGVVSYVGWNPWDQEGRAFMIVVAHPGGFETLYGHCLPTRAVRVGEVVKKGEVIGYMGNTGRSTGTHLHLELRRGRTTLNPLAFL